MPVISINYRKYDIRPQHNYVFGSCESGICVTKTAHSLQYILLNLSKEDL